MVFCDLAVRRRVLHLEPDPRTHPGLPDGLRRLLDPVREFRLRHVPVADAGPPRCLAVPARVDHEGVDPVTAEGFNAFLHVLLGRVAPGRAVFVEQHGEGRVRSSRRRCMQILQPLGDGIEAADPDGQKSGGCLEGFARIHGFRPVPGFIIRETARQTELVPLPPRFHLPRGRTRDLRRPRHARLPVLRREEGEIMPHGHGADLRKLLAAHAATGPRGLEMVIDQGPGFDFSFRAPPGSGAVQDHPVRRAGVAEGSQHPEGKARQGLEHGGFIRSVLEDGLHGERAVPGPVGQKVDHGVSPAVLHAGLDHGDAVFFRHGLAFEYHSVSRRRAGGGETARIPGGQSVPADGKLDERFEVMGRGIGPVGEGGGDKAHPDMPAIVRKVGDGHIAEFTAFQKIQLFHFYGFSFTIVSMFSD